MRRLALLLPLALLVFGSAGAAGPAHAPGAAATAWAIRISPSGGTAAGTPTVTSPPPAQPAAGGAFAYPSDGSIVAAGSTTASASTAVTTVAAAKASATVTALSLFGGEITADAVTAQTSAGTGPSGAGGNDLGSAVTNLKVEGQPVTGTHVTLGDWGELTIGAQGIDRTAPAGAKGYRGYVTELDVHLTADHDGLPANSEIQIGYAESDVQTAPPAAPPVTSTTAQTTTSTTPAPPPPPDNTPAGDTPRDRASHVPAAGGPRPLYQVQPKLTGGPYVFPVYGPSSYVDTYGAGRSDVSGGWHHGDDIFGSLGQPLVACANGTLFSVGWNTIGGNRLWLLDSQGNQFYYAHLSAYAAVAVDGAHVHAGEVIGFMGNTGDAQGTPYHLHFEIHPVSLLYLGYDGAVDPTPYLDAWSHQKSLPFPLTAAWAPVVPGSGSAPEPGAILLGMSDISAADGLDPASLRRALTPLKPPALMQTLVPTVPAPSAYPGRG